MKKLILMLIMFAPLAAFAQTPKFGHLNTQEIMASMPELIKVRGELEATAKQYENDLKAMQDELQRKAAGLSGQLRGIPEGSAGEDAAYHNQAAQRH